MSDKVKGGIWVKGGETPNKYGRGGDPNKPKQLKVKRSKLRGIEAKLMKIVDLALENIERSANGDSKLSKETITTSKWVVQTTVLTNRAALAEEVGLNKLTDPLLQEALTGNQAEDETSGARFSLKMIRGVDN